MFLWALLALDYAWRLRRVLDERRAEVVRALADFAARAREWEGVFAEGAQRERRDSAAALERLLQQLDGETRLAAKVGVAQSAAPLLTRQQDLLVSHPDSFPQAASACSLALRQALARVEGSFGQYAAARADATFLSTRFPLAELASLAGLPRSE